MSPYLSEMYVPGTHLGDPHLLGGTSTIHHTCLGIRGESPSCTTHACSGKGEDLHHAPGKGYRVGLPSCTTPARVRGTEWDLHHAPGKEYRVGLPSCTTPARVRGTERDLHHAPHMLG